MHPIPPPLEETPKPNMQLRDRTKSICLMDLRDPRSRTDAVVAIMQDLAATISRAISKALAEGIRVEDIDVRWFNQFGPENPDGTIGHFDVAATGVKITPHDEL